MTLATPPTDVVERATRRAAVEVHELASPAETARGAELLREVWGGPETVVPHNLMRAVQQTGGYVFGAYDLNGALVAVSVGFLAAEGLHSHITGVTPTGQHRGLGFALKQHQRAWALARGLTTITWTCDPLVQRNVGFNLHALGATVEAYLPNHYGEMADALNAGDETDRFAVRWDLLSVRAVAAEGGRLPFVSDTPPYAVRVGDHGEPVVLPVTAPARRVQLPRDVEAVRRKDPAVARAWRYAVRDAVLAGLDAGVAVVGLAEDGSLVLEEAS